MAALASLRNHPFPVRAHFERSLVVTLSAPAAALSALLPPPLELDTHQNVGFIAVALVKTLHLRPAALPPWLGQNFYLAGYRIFVLYRNREGRRLRGLYILRSLTDRRRMGLLGSLFTRYAYRTVGIEEKSAGELLTIHSQKAGFRVTVDRAATDPELPPTSCFTDWREARRFAGPLPFTFSYLPDSREVLIVEGVRQQWKPRPLRLVEAHFPYVDALVTARPASVFEVTDVPYSWKAGLTEAWKG